MNNCRVDLTRFPVFPSPCSDDNTDTNNNSTVTDEVFIEAQGALMTSRFLILKTGSGNTKFLQRQILLYDWESFGGAVMEPELY